MKLSRKYVNGGWFERTERAKDDSPGDAPENKEHLREFGWKIPQD